MNITDRAQKVLAEIDAALALAEKATPNWEMTFNTPPAIITSDKSHLVCQGDRFIHRENALNDFAFIAASRALLPASLRMLKTAIEGLLRVDGCWDRFKRTANHLAEIELAAIFDQWGASK